VLTPTPSSSFPSLALAAHDDRALFLLGHGPRTVDGEDVIAFPLDAASKPTIVVPRNVSLAAAEQRDAHMVTSQDVTLVAWTEYRNIDRGDYLSYPQNAIAM